MNIIFYFFGILPVISLIGLGQLLYNWQKEKDWRFSALLSSLIWGVFVVITSEFLGYIQKISQISLTIVWLLATTMVLILWIRNRCYNYFKKILIYYYIIPIILIIIITGIVAIIYPPNNWDSMTYHLPKIEQWLQNKSLNHFETSIARQTVLAPFAELCILQLRGISDSDLFVNIIQWLAFIGCIINVSNITKILGGNINIQISSSIFCATIPMAILQASSTQTDLVISYWLTCIVILLLKWLHLPQTKTALALGTALGLAILTKGTAYPLALPFIIIFAYHVLINTKKYIFVALCAAFIAILLNTPHLIRNYKSYGDPLGRVTGHYMPSITLNGFCILFLGNLLSNEPYLPDNIYPCITNHTNSIIKYILRNLDILSDDPRYIEPGSNILNRRMPVFHEDTVGNPIHVFLIIISLLYLLIFWTKNTKYTNLYIISYISSSILFCLLFKWNYFITRLQLPLFILGSSFFPIIMQKINKKPIFLIFNGILLAYSIFPVLFNQSRPLIVCDKLKTNSINIYNSSRHKLYFSNRIDLYSSYMKAITKLQNSNAIDIGLIIGGDSWEYPLRKILHDKNIRAAIKHVCRNNNKIPPSIEALFILDPTVNHCQNISLPQGSQPTVIFLK